MEFREQELYDLIRQGINKCQELKRPLLISYVSGAGTCRPLTFFRNAEARRTENLAYWSAATGSLTLVGAGCAYSIQVEETSSGRFAKVETAWRVITADSIRVSSADIPQTGLILMGGGAFDPLRPQSDRWRNFAAAEFHLPQLLLTCAEGKSWLTINYLVNGKENPGETTACLLKERAALLQGVEERQFAEQNALSITEINPDKWMKLVDEIAGRIRQGELQKVVLARELCIHSEEPVSIEKLLTRLYRDQAGSYIFAFRHQGDCLVGASPERLIRREGERFYSMCLAGSIRRGGTESEDRKLGEQLLTDSKNLHEHSLVVRMIGDKLNKYCEELQIPQDPVLLKLKDIQHLCITLAGKARVGTSLLSVLADLHPTPALGGFPQQSAMQKIREAEPLDRGWYGGPLGWVDAGGNGEFIVAIRCGLVRGKEISLFAGCGIVGDSDPASEYEETGIKFRPMLAALGGN